MYINHSSPQYRRFQKTEIFVKYVHNLFTKQKSETSRGNKKNIFADVLNTKK